MKFLLVASLLLVAFATFTNGQIAYKDCGSVVGQILSVNVSGCASSPCNLKKGNSYTVMVAFASQEQTDTAEAEVYGIISGISVPFPIDHPDACDGSSGLKCPLSKGQKYQYISTLAVKEAYPDVKVIVKWQLTDKKDSGNVIFCFETPVAVVG